MKIDSIEKLNKVTSSAAYNLIPLRIAEKSQHGAKWWDISNAMTEAAADLQIWEAAQWISLLFDTYGEALKTVELRIKTDTDRGEVYVNNYIYINSEPCDPDCCEIEDEVLANRIEEIDGGKLLNAAVEALYDTAGWLLMPQLDRLQRVFSDPFSSSEQMQRHIDSEAGGSIRETVSLLEQTQFEQNTESANKPRRPPGRI